MNTINPPLPPISHRARPQALSQTTHGKREDADNALRSGKSAAEPQAKGVLRLLQENHFKGVADLRLRINFYEQLQALENANAQDTARQAIDAFDQAVSDSIAQHPQVAAQAIEELQGFQASLRQLAAAGDDAASIGDAVGEAFGNLTKSLRELLGSDAQTQPEVILDPDSGVVDRISPPEVTAAESKDDGVDVEALIVTLETGLSNFETALSSSTDTHHFTRPNGNGRAFDKFLEIYEALSSGDGLPDSDEQATPLIDQTA